MIRRAAAAAALCWLTAAGASPAPRITLAALDAFESHKTSVVLPGGLRLAYLDIGPRDAPPLLLIHGYTDSSRDWAPLAPLLQERYRLIIVDLRGHGASDKPPCCYSRFDFAYDLKLLLDSLHVSSCDVAGHSLGSIVAQAFAEEWPERTRRLILISSTGTSFAPLTDDSGAGTAAPGWMSGVAALRDPIDPDSTFMREWWHESLSINPEFFSSRQRRDAAAIPAVVWRAILDQGLLGIDLRPMLPRVRAPTLLIWGGRDTLATAPGRLALQQGIHGSQVRNFPELGHDLFWQDPRAVADTIIRFLDKG
ncbi:MAG: alpha/beta hydrolase [Proteobacteria bacterium]|nr:alpha/beta hydrolase [Pseudomonadota bacterium]